MSFTMSAGRSALARLIPNKSALLVCDVQEKFRPGIKYFDGMVKQVGRLLKAAEILDMPLLVSEQYSKGLGHTVIELDTKRAKQVVEKDLFSMVVPEIEPLLKEWGGDSPSEFSIILCGVEAHVCVMQTAIDLRRRNFNVFVCVDACSSRTLMDRNFGYQRMRDAGCVLTTVETALFELTAGSNNKHFKDIKQVILEIPADMELKYAAL